MEISWQALALIIFLIVVLGLMFSLVFRWMQRAEMSSYLGAHYRESVLQLERTRLSRPAEEKRTQGEYVKDAILQNPWAGERPKHSRELSQLIEEHRKRSDINSRPGSGKNLFGGTGTGGLGSSWTMPPGLLETDRPELPYLSIDNLENADTQKLVDGYNQQVEDHNKALREWQSAIKQAAERAFRAELEIANERAQKLAEKAADVDIGVFRGRGPAFVLEFTAIVVIIFAAVTLGILEKLTPDQIGTLLAAIAGYVLGKATPGGKGDPEKGKGDLEKVKGDLEKLKGDLEKVSPKTHAAGTKAEAKPQAQPV